jgi:hypothetical protein
LEASQERYRVGAATLVELTQARTAHVQVASALVSARYNLLFQQTLLDYYVGDLDPDTVTLGVTEVTPSLWAAGPLPAHGWVSIEGYGHALDTWRT